MRFERLQQGRVVLREKKRMGQENRGQQPRGVNRRENRDDRVLLDSDAADGAAAAADDDGEENSCYGTEN